MLSIRTTSIGANCLAVCKTRRQAGTRSTSTGYRAAGFTLVELLVVIAIIGLLIGMTLPAVQMVREAARKAKCQSNIHNLGLAALNYESAHRAFPQGATKTYLHSWATLTLPFLEQQAVFDQIQLNKAWNSPENLAVASQDLEIFHCPSSRKYYNGKTDYCGISGSWRVKVAPPPGQMNGIFYPVYDSRHRVRMAAVQDGASQTIAIAEGVSVEEGNQGYWACGFHCFSHEDGGINELFLPADEITSHHPGGANAVMCDGSVHLLTEDIDADVVAALCTRNASETIPAF